MFGKTRDHTETADRAETDATIGEFFGDEAAVADGVRIDRLQDRVLRVEQQVSSQFTSLAAYAQIAQEQVELVRSEAAHANERSEQKVIALLDRERADRVNGPNGGVDVTARLDSLELQIGEIRVGLQQCLSNQKALADAITDLFRTRVADDEVADDELEIEPDMDMDELVTVEAVGDDLFVDDMPAPSAMDMLPPPMPGAGVEPVDFPKPGLIDGPIDGLALT